MHAKDFVRGSINMVAAMAGGAVSKNRPKRCNVGANTSYSHKRTQQVSITYHVHLTKDDRLEPLHKFTVNGILFQRLMDKSCQDDGKERCGG